MDAESIKDQLRHTSELQLSAGEHTLNGDLRITRPCVIRGTGPAGRTFGTILRGGRLIIESSDVRVEDISLVGPGPSHDVPRKPAVEVHGVAELTRVSVYSWPGRAFWIQGSVTQGTDASRSRLTRCRAAMCAEHGFVTEGADANAVVLDQCDARDLGGVGFYDLSFLGCVYQACMAHACDEAGYSNDVRLDSDQSRINANQSSVFLGCYCESDSKIRVGTPGMWIGAHNSPMIGNGLWLNGNNVRFPKLVGARVQTDDKKSWDLDKSLAAGKLVP